MVKTKTLPTFTLKSANRQSDGTAVISLEPTSAKSSSSNNLSNIEFEIIESDDSDVDFISEDRAPAKGAMGKFQELSVIKTEEVSPEDVMEDCREQSVVNPDVPIKCSYPGCHYNTHDDPTVRMFGFPVNNVERCYSWMANTGYKECSLPSLSQKFICQHHFADSMFVDDKKKTELKPNAIPISHIFSSVFDIDQSAVTANKPLGIERFDDRRFSLNPIISNEKCVVPKCNTEIPTKLAMVQVPKNSIRRKMWETTIGIKLKDTDKVCEKHFTAGDVLKCEFVKVAGVLRKHYFISPEVRSGCLPCLTVIRGCCVPNCINSNRDTKFMANIDLDNIEEWLKRIKNVSLKNKSDLGLLRFKICELHFTGKDIMTYQMGMNNIVPTLNLPDESVTTDTPTLRNPQQGSNLSATEMCSYINCKNSRLTRNCFNFPANQPDRLSQWVENCGNPDVLWYYENNRQKLFDRVICEDHFEKYCFPDNCHSKDVLLKTAIPRYYRLDNPETGNQVYTCAYVGCNARPGEKRFYSFPNDIQRAKKWLSACGQTKLLTLSDEVISLVISTWPGVCMGHLGVRKSREREFAREVQRPITQSASGNTAPQNNNDNSFKICSYHKCKHPSTETRKVFSFPDDESLRLKWFKAARIPEMPGEDLKRYMKRFGICSRHFKYYEFDLEHNLKPNAVPIAREDLDSYMEEMKRKYEVKKELTKSFPCVDLNFPFNKEIFMGCPVQECTSNLKTSDIPFHYFPDPAFESERFEIWIKLISDAELSRVKPDNVYKLYRICSLHFESCFFDSPDKKNLKLEAIPTIGLKATIGWLAETIYYKVVLSNFFKENNVNDLAISRFDTAWSYYDYKEIQDDHPTKCILASDGLIFPKISKKLCLTRDGDEELPYDVYTYNSDQKEFKRKVRVSSDDAVYIHTAIIIDEDENEEKCLKDIFEILKNTEAESESEDEEKDDEEDEDE